MRSSGTDVLSNTCSCVKASERPKERYRSGQSLVARKQSVTYGRRSMPPLACRRTCRRPSAAPGARSSASEHRAVAPGEDELPQRLAIELLRVVEVLMLDGAVEAAPVDHIGVPATHSAAPDHQLAQLLDPGDALVPGVPDQREPPAGPEHTGDLARARARGRTSGTPARHVTTSAEPSGSGIDSALPITASASGTAARSSPSISGSGSTAVTRCPSATSERVSFPVPAPRSTTSQGVSPASQRTASSG